MGSWHETCYMSHLPIHCKDNAVVVILTPTMYIDENRNFCYHDDKYAPLYFPLRGQYNDYGSLTNIQNAHLHESLLSHMKQYFTIEDGEYALYNWKGIEQFLSDIASRKVFVSVLTKGYRRLILAFVHAELYDSLVNHMSNRKIYNSDQSVAESRLTRYRTAVATFKSYLEKAPLSGIFCEYMILEPMKYRHLELIVREHIISGMDAHESDFVEFMLWHEVMSLARIGYGINGGCTGEENEYAIPMIIAKFILKKSVEYQKWMMEDNPGLSAEDALEECVYR